MKNYFQITICALALASGLAVGPARAESGKEDAVARIYEIKGPKFEFHRADENEWKSGTKDMAGYIKDHFRTDGDTVAALELLIGGRVGIKKGTEIEILNEGEVDSVSKTVRKIVLKSGGIWAKFNKQDKPLTIQTRGGVMGIKGTEFVVDTAESGESSVALLEGSVDYTDGSGQSQQMAPGQKLRQVKKNDKLYVVHGAPDKVDELVGKFERDEVSPEDFVRLGYGIWNTSTSVDLLRDAVSRECPEAGMFLDFLRWNGVINWGGWSIPSIPVNVPSVPGIPGIPGF